MSFADKELCSRCGHPRHQHTGNHIRGHRTICRRKMPQNTQCACQVFTGRAAHDIR
jgi:hypothetical protein